VVFILRRRENGAYINDALSHAIVHVSVLTAVVLDRSE